MSVKNAIVRPPAPNLGDGITTASLGSPSFERACAQHAEYCRALRDAGATVTLLAPDEHHPDAHFVEDTAILAPEFAVLARPGAAPRLGEAAAMRAPLARFFAEILEIVEPGTLDGGDVCQADEHVYIGISQRTNPAGAAQLAALLRKAGKRCTLVDVRDLPGMLHLKSGLSYLGDGRFATIDALASQLGVSAGRLLRVIPSEAYGANCVRINDVVLIASGHPRLRDDLAKAGYSTAALDISEYAKMDGGLSCLSLRF